MQKNTKNSKQIRVSLKDIWNAFMVDGAQFTTKDIPICPTRLTHVPKEIITWTEAKRIHKKMYQRDKNYSYDALICFYQDDQYFDGPLSSIWFFWWRAIKVIKHFNGIITPDFSTYQDFPYPIKLYNTYRMRAFGYWIWKKGLDVVNNVRWGTQGSFDYCFDGILPQEIIAIGTVGGSPRKHDDRDRFELGLKKAVAVLQPHTIIVYGSANYPCFENLRQNGILIIQYNSQTCDAFKRSKCHE